MRGFDSRHWLHIEQGLPAGLISIPPAEHPDALPVLVPYLYCEGLRL